MTTPGRWWMLGFVPMIAGCVPAFTKRDVVEIDQLLADHGAPDLGWQGNHDDEATVAQWLAEPMTAERAVRMAMLRSPQLQGEYARLGLARADVLKAVQTANPYLTVSYLTPTTAGESEQWTVGLALPLADLLVLPARLRLVHADYARARHQVAAAVLGVVTDVEAAWYRTIGARQVADMRSAVAVAMVASADLAGRFYEAGNISELQLKQQQAAASEARIDAALAEIAAGTTRLELITIIGLSGEQAAWTTSDRLPLPVETEDDPEQLAAMARESNLALLAARAELAVLEDSLGIARATGWLGDTTIGYEQERKLDGATLHGPTANIEVPLFDQGQAERVRALAQVAQARARLTEIEVGGEHAVRSAAERVSVLREVVRLYREALIPQRERVVERAQQQQNFMLIGVFELIHAKTREYDAYQGYLESIRDYWLARADLARAVGARLPSDAEAKASTPSVEEILSQETPNNPAKPGATQPAAMPGHGAHP